MRLFVQGRPICNGLNFAGAIARNVTNVEWQRGKHRWPRPGPPILDAGLRGFIYLAQVQTDAPQDCKVLSSMIHANPAPAFTDGHVVINGNFEFV